MIKERKEKMVYIEKEGQPLQLERVIISNDGQGRRWSFPLRTIAIEIPGYGTLYIPNAQLEEYGE